METNNGEQKSMDLKKIIKILWNKKKSFYKLWIWTFVLSCIWILPKPRYYSCEVGLAPEINGEGVGGGLSSIASSFGFNLGGISGQDAIYPELYPELFDDPEFIVGLYNIHVVSKDGEISTDYYDYMKNYQKSDPLTYPFRLVINAAKKLFEDKEDVPAGDGVNPFMMSKDDYDLMQNVMANISCYVDKKNNVITIKVQDQDPLICATMADSVKVHLQDFITGYRTSKAKEDVIHYQQARDSIEKEYDKARIAYSQYSDTHKDAILQIYQSQKEKLEMELSLKQTSLTAMETQLQASKVKLQEKTPAFTTLKNAMVPIKPAGPKRMLFVIGMLVLVSTIKGFILVKEFIL